MMGLYNEGMILVCGVELRSVSVFWLVYSVRAQWSGSLSCYFEAAVVHRQRPRACAFVQQSSLDRDMCDRSIRISCALPYTQHSLPSHAIITPAASYIAYKRMQSGRPLLGALARHRKFSDPTPARPQ